MLRRGDFVPATTTTHFDAGVDDMAQLYPTLWSFLTQSTWEDGTTRETGSLLVFTDDGLFKAMLRDKSNGTCLWVTARSLTELFPVLEASILSPGVDWRKDRLAALTAKGKKPGK